MKKLIPLSLLVWLLAGHDWGQTCTTTINTFPYFQNFDSGAGGWTSGGTSSSWALGAPSKATISAAASLPNAWVTNLTGNYNNDENSYVQSPCFNFTTLVQPIFSAKIFWDAENSWDGAVLQSSINGGLTWQNVGVLNAPNNWFNHGSISSAPGGQSIGWSGSASSFPPNGSNGWVLAKHALTGLGGQPNVRLRFAFGSDFIVSYGGFGFDDVAIIETPSIDIQVSTITAPTSGCALTASENVCVTITNRGLAAQANIPVSYQIGTNAPVTETVTNSIAPG
ncbi:MAG TPA: hypothetical protein VEV15_10185, partial [Flavisolibacter sp.]|nr:hypothetical protein [Flavisolibacter sp.]